jgi:hypothetical protein
MSSEGKMMNYSDERLMTVTAVIVLLIAILFGAGIIFTTTIGRWLL